MPCLFVENVWVMIFMLLATHTSIYVITHTERYSNGISIRAGYKKLKISKWSQINVCEQKIMFLLIIQFPLLYNTQKWNINHSILFYNFRNDPKYSIFCITNFFYTYSVTLVQEFILNADFASCPQNLLHYLTYKCNNPWASVLYRHRTYGQKGVQRYKHGTQLKDKYYLIIWRPQTFKMLRNIKIPPPISEYFWK